MRRIPVHPGRGWIERVRVVWLTARRAGIKRSAARVRRIFLLRLAYPRFAARLYPRRVVRIPEHLHTLHALHTGQVDKWDGTICLLHSAPFEMRTPVDWNANPISHTLWQFRLHEWEWAYPLIQKAETDAVAANDLTALLSDYITRVPVGHPIAYEPYPLSRRLVVWCEALRVLNSRGADAIFLQTLASEMDRGARMLAGNIEHDLDNNHVIANARALAFVGSLLDRSYAQAGYALLWRQLRNQVRADGVHVENSTTYHFLVWRDAVTTCLLAKWCGYEIPADILPRLTAMRDFLSSIRYSDGTFPLLNDSVQDEFQDFDSIKAGLEQNFSVKNSVPDLPFPRLFADSGYALWRAGETQLVFDAGALGPTYCPGHGHADTLSFELFAYGQPRIVDAGTYQYQAGAWRDFFRGTAAHNTLQVDDLDSSEVSGSFRVGRMANARLWLQDGWVCGEHDGYARLPEPVTHRRRIQMRDANTILLRDEISGRGQHSYALRFHLAPDASAHVSGETATVRYTDNLTLRIKFGGAPGAPQIADGWHSPMWYTKLPVKLIELRWQGPACIVVETELELKWD